MIQFFSALLAITSFIEPTVQWPNPLPAGFYQIDSVALPNEARVALSNLSAAVGRVEILERDTNQLINVGTGYIVTPGDRAVTALHVVNEMMEHSDQLKAQLKLDSGEIFELSKIIKKDDARDYISFELDRKHPAFLKEVQNETAQPSLRIFSVGYPYGRPKHISMGYLIERSKQDEELWMTSMASVPGMSGSPTIAIGHDGKILGVIGNLHGTEWVRQLPEIPGALLLSIGAWDEINRRLLRLAETENPQEAMVAKRNEDGKWESSEFLKWWQNTQAQPLVITLHNLKIATDNAQRDKANEFFDLVLNSLRELETKVGKTSKVSDVKSSVEKQLLEIYQTSATFLKSRLTGYQVIVDTPQATPTEIREIVIAIKSSEDAKTIISNAIKEFEAAQKTVDERFKNVSRKTAFLDSPEEVMKWILDGQASKDLENASRFLNEKQLRLPGYITLNPGE